MNKTIGLLAHVDAGKTTFAEQLLYHTKSIKQRGRVDHKDAFLDSHEIERTRGITVFADQAVMMYNGSTYHLIDTPGHVDFSPEMERALQVMDYAVVIISAVEGVEGHTETVWQLLRRYEVPAFFFINKTDRTGAEVSRVLQEIRSNLTEDVCDLTASDGQPILSGERIAFLAERDETLLEAYMNESGDTDMWLNAMRSMIKNNKIFPCFSGSALQDTGIADFLEKMDSLTFTAYAGEAAFSGRVFKIRHDEQGTRITFIKATSGSLKVRDEIEYGTGDGRRREKVTQIRMYNGKKYESVDRVTSGSLFAVTGLSMASAGEGLGTLTTRLDSELVPTLKTKVLFPPTVHVKEVLSYFRLLDAEDPSLHVVWDEHLQEIHIHVMGTIQLEVLTQLVQERFNLSVTFGNPEILYKETIDAPVIGYGHFEPLGHYAEVHLKLEPAERNSGITFENACHADDLAPGFQHAVHQHLFEREHHGLLTGSPITDMKVTLLTGRAHNKHTSGGDFREAAYRALRQGLEKVENVLLEPFYNFKIKVGLDHIGRVLTDIQQAHGRFEPPEISDDKASIAGSVPVATFMNYSTELASFTQGKGAISLVYGGYDRCHRAAEVIAMKGYDKHADPAYTSSSIFCSKGQAYSVPWDQAEAHMHA